MQPRATTKGSFFDYIKQCVEKTRLRAFVSIDRAAFEEVASKREIANPHQKRSGKACFRDVENGEFLA